MSQTDRLLALLADGNWHDTPEILEKVYGGSHLGIARISARALDAKKRIGPYHKIESRRKPGSETIWEYRKSAIEARPEGELFPKRYGVTG